MESREYQRMEIQGLDADISDGVGFFPGVVSDVSRFGFRMVDLPKRISSEKRRMTVVVSGHGRNFKMLVRPKWAADKGLRKTIGFEILNTPWEWTAFVMKQEPFAEPDVWDVISL